MLSTSWRWWGSGCGGADSSARGGRQWNASFDVPSFGIVSDHLSENAPIRKHGARGGSWTAAHEVAVVDRLADTFDIGRSWEAQLVHFNIGAFIDSFATVVALVGVAVTFWLTRRGQKQDLVLAREEADRAERAQRAGEASAERSEAASSLTIDALTRMAEGLEQLREGPQGARSLGQPVAWSLTHFNGDTYQLTNIGRVPADDVKVHTHETLLVPRPLPDGETVGPGEAVTFMALRTMGTSDSTITVTWIDETGSEGRWRYPLPPRPGR